MPTGQVSAVPTGPVSGAAFFEGENTDTGIPVPHDPGAAWTGRPQANHPWAAPPPPRRARRGAPRGAMILAIAASLAVIVLAAGTIWFVRDAVGDTKEPGTGAQGPNATTTGASASPTANRGPAPTGFAWCEAPEKALFCPTTPVCESEDDDEIDCAKAHTTELFAGGILPSEGFAGSDQLDKSPEVKAGCSAATLDARTADKNKTKDWNRYAQWQWRNGVNLFLCFTGPENGTTTGSVIKQAT
ncbi:hypothetical protein GCM10009558_065640 [Virgisporangium aurantiacum]